MNTLQEYKIGDCLDLLPSIPDKSVDLILTDLPYGQTACKWDSIIDLERLWSEYKRILTTNGAIVLTCTFKFGVTLVNNAPDMFRYDLVWEKTKATGFLNANKMPMRNHEMILVFYNHLPTFNPQYTKGGPGHHKIGDETLKDNPATQTRENIYGNDFLINAPNWTEDGIRNPVSVIKPDEVIHNEIYGGDIPYVGDHMPNVEGHRMPVSIVKHQNGNNKTVHPTQKPLSLWKYIIETYTNLGDTVHDSCLGSGTTLEACLNLNRNCTCFELSDEWEDNYKRIQSSGKGMWKLSKIFGKDLS